MEITVLICTRNNGESLRDTLECLLTQEGAQGLEYEIVVVDNQSTDGTRAVLEAYAQKFAGRLRYFYERRRGKPFALNLGVHHARGAIIASTDDDCLPASDYLLRLHESFAAYKDITYLGGPISPHWEGCTPPAWLKDSFLANLAMLDYGDAPFLIDGKNEKRDVYGANFAFRRQAFDRFGGFCLEREYTQDIEIIRRILEGGGTGLYAPAVRVRHKVTPKRVTKSYFYHWHFKKGRMRAYDGDITVKAIYPLGVPFWLWRASLKQLVRLCRVEDEYQALRERCHFFSQLGFICEQAKRHIV